MFRFFIALLLVSTLSAGPVERVRRYDGDKIVQVHPETEAHLTILRALQSNQDMELDFWVEPNLRLPVDIHVPQSSVNTIKSLLNEAAIKFEVKVENLQGLVDAERAEIEMHQKLDAARAEADDATVCPWWYPNCRGSVNPGNTAKPKTKNTKSQDSVIGKWITHSEVNSFLARMQSNYGSRVSVTSIGNSYEGRDMKMIKISNGSGRNKPQVFVESTIHAREWLTQGTTNYIIDKLAREYETDSTVKALLDAYDFYIIPIANPDGYDYTHTNERLWRKTRSRLSGTSCRGVDPNRNWDFHWGESGVSSNPCADTYPGESPFSEVETRNIRDAVNSLSNVKLYFGLHSYSQLWLTPWAYGSAKPSDNSEMMRVAHIGEAALRATHNKAFQVGAPPDILYAASGGSYDWAKGVAGIKYSYTLELRPSGSSWNGFIVSEATIIPSGEEVFAGLNAICLEILKAGRRG